MSQLHPGSYILARAIPDKQTQNRVILDLCDHLSQGEMSLRDARLLITMETQLGLSDEQIGQIVDFAKNLCRNG